MTTKKLSSQELGELLHKSRHEPRQNVRRFAAELGYSASDLDSLLTSAATNKSAVRIADTLAPADKTDSLEAIARVAELMATVKLGMDKLGITQEEMAKRCGFTQPQLSDYFRGVKIPGADKLAKMASALGASWHLISIK